MTIPCVNAKFESISLSQSVLMFNLLTLNCRAVLISATIEGMLVAVGLEIAKALDIKDLG